MLFDRMVGFHVQRDITVPLSEAEFYADLAHQHDLSPRQAQALMHILEHGSINIQEFEELCPEVNRRTLQRELRRMVEKGVLVTDGATNRLIYRLKE